MTDPNPVAADPGPAAAPAPELLPLAELFPRDPPRTEVASIV